MFPESHASTNYNNKSLTHASLPESRAKSCMHRRSSMAESTGPGRPIGRRRCSRSTRAQQHTPRPPPCATPPPGGLLGGGHGLPAAAGLVGAAGAGHGRGLLHGGHGAGLLHALVEVVVLDLLLPALLAAECHLAPARHGADKQNPAIMSCYITLHHPNSGREKRTLSTKRWMRDCDS
jgi:hypothetical protein